MATDDDYLEVRFPYEVLAVRRTYRDYKDYPLLEPQDFVRIHARDLLNLLRKAGEITA